MRLDERDFLERIGFELRVTLEKFGGAKDRLQRVVQLVRDARDQHADRRQPFLPNDLVLERLQRLAGAPLLLDLPVERIVRLAKVRRHGHERVLQTRQLAVGYRASFGRRQVAVGDALHRQPHSVHTATHPPGQHHCHHQHGANGGIRDHKAAPELRCRARHRHAGRDADAQQPRAAIDDSVAVKTADAVEPGQHLHPLDLTRRRLAFADDGADEPLRLETPRKHAAFRIS